MRSTQSSASATAATLAGLIAEGRAVTRVVFHDEVPPEAVRIVKEIGTTIGALSRERQRLVRGGDGTSVADMVRRASAAAGFARISGDDLLPLVTRLELAGAVIELLPGRRQDDDWDGDPEHNGAPITIELHITLSTGA